MSSTVDHTTTVTIPSVEEFAERFPQYGPRASGESEHYFDLVMTPDVFITAACLTLCLRIPAVTAIAEQAATQRAGNITGTDKQFLGALMCSLMEHNGFTKTGRKGSVPHPAWNRGEVYALAAA